VPTVIVPNQRSSSKSVKGSATVALFDVAVSFSSAGLLLVAVKVPLNPVTAGWIAPVFFSMAASPA
jgi:hypothetical protein